VRVALITIEAVNTKRRIREERIIFAPL